MDALNHPLDIEVMEDSKLILSKIMHKTKKVNGCFIWCGAISAGGYGGMKMLGKGCLVHRLVYKLTNPDENIDGMLICHRCDVRACVNPNHLFLGTHRENTQDCKKKGRIYNRSGERNSNFKLTSDDVSMIRTLLSNGLSLSQIASKYGVHFTTISRIKRGLNWKKTL